MEAGMSGFRSNFRVGDRQIGDGAPCYVIAEGGVNHFGNMETAYALIDLAVDSGADAFKTQHFKTDVLVGPSSPEWRERLRTKELPDDDILRMKEYCDKRNITFLCTPHDEAALEVLETKVGVPAYKVGSGEVENWPYLAKVARLGKPVILSTGMYELSQVEEAAEVLSGAGCKNLAILHCFTSYPANPKDVNLGVMSQIRAFFQGPVGYSDHTEGTAVPLAAVAMGAEVIEKHITIDRDVPNAQDWKVSCDPSNLGKFVADIREIEDARGGNPKTVAEAERSAILWARKSLTAARNIPSGSVVKESDLIAQRPGNGIPASRIGEIAGRTVKVDIAEGTPIEIDFLL
jgi:N,N'-diacetyllegionaminate synthase